jgi:hypothetical protein
MIGGKMVVVGRGKRGASFDPDALAFITAAGITGNRQKTAINTLVLSLKLDNTWDRLDAFYPYCPIDDSTATLSAYKFNLKDPRDLDAAFRITWVNSPTATIAGVQGNGSNQYGRTHYIPSAQSLLNDHMFGWYANGYLSSSMGARDAAYNTAFSSFWGCNNAIISSPASGFTNINALRIVQRSSASLVETFQNSSTPLATSTISSTTRPSVEYWLLGQNFNNSITAATSLLHKSHFIGKSLTTSQITTIINAINTFNSEAR